VTGPNGAPATVVAGDRFTEFLANRGTAPVSRVLAGLRSGELAPDAALIPGQGLSGDELRELAALTGVAGAVPADRALTHKHVAENVLIGAPVRVDGERWSAPLLLDERVEVLADHLTGQHIPAVTLLEAARQTWTVVTERLLGEDAGETRFVIRSIRSTFHRLVFPLPATLDYRLLERRETPGGHAFAAELTVIQDAQVAAEFEVVIQVIPRALAVRQESMAARAAIRAAQQRYAEAAASPAPAGVGTR
jgi:hypothetical protein